MSVEKMPCPTCGEDIAKPQPYRSEIECSCGVMLRIMVPIFAINAPPYGWKWVRT